MKNGIRVRLKLVIFTIFDNLLQVFLPQGRLPKTDVEKGKKLDLQARDCLTQIVEVLPNTYVEQLYTITDPVNPDELTIAYFILLCENLVGNDLQVSLVPLKKITNEIYEYSIIEYALQRLRWKIEYTNVVYSLLPEKFTLSELQSIYEAILGRRLDKRNFRKKIFSLSILKPAGEKIKKGRARPAELFSFKKKQLQYVEIL